jgi:hypothetical protein
MTKSTRNIKNNILAILAAPAAMPPKPKTAAIMAKIIKVIVHRNIKLVFKINDVGTLPNY